MKAPTLSIGEVLDGASELASRVFAPWAGVLWLLSIPVRLLQAHLAGRLLELGAEAVRYGSSLHRIALAATAAFVLCVLGRALFVRACALALRTRRVPGREVLRLPAGGLLGYLYVALLFEALFFATAISLVTIPALILLSGLAAATSVVPTRPGLLAPIREVFRHGAPGKVLVALLAVFTAALALCAVNLYFVFQIGLWLLQGVPGLELGAWQARLSLANPAFGLLLAAGASLAVEPYWLAALTVYVQKLRSRESGEDLRLWFEGLRGAAAA